MIITNLVKLVIVLAIFAPFLYCAEYFLGNDNLSDVLQSSWNYYKSEFITKEGRVIDPQKGGITTSEGQAYALLRAVMINDKETFTKIYKWTNNNLKREQDHLYSWLWGSKDGKFEVIDINSASDADIDIAYALILASKIWHNPEYLDDAKKIISDIWNKETVDIKGKRVLTSGIAQAKDEIIEINPSYFAPYAFRLFALHDKKHDWNNVVNSSYKLLNSVSDMTGSKLPPDWFLIDSRTGSIRLCEKKEKNNFSYDAIRIFFRFYIDNEVSCMREAEKFLSKTGFFLGEWQREKRELFLTHFDENGKASVDYEDIGGIALLLPIINHYDEKLARKIYRKKIKRYFNRHGYWKDPQNYYIQNLTWIGIWIYANEKESKRYIEQAY